MTMQPRYQCSRCRRVFARPLRSVYCPHCMEALDRKISGMPQVRRVPTIEDLFAEGLDTLFL